MTRIATITGLLLFAAATHIHAPVSLGPVGAAEAQSADPQTADAESADTETADTETAGVQEMTLGDPDAPVTVVEYASFTCPHCASFHTGPFEQLKSEYIDTGKVELVYREVYFDRFGLWAGMLARCAGEERYFGLVDLLYENQAEWLSGDGPAAIADNLRRLGRTAGLSDEEVNACLQDSEKAQAMVAAYQQNAEADNITSTPSFVIDGELHSNMPYDEFAATLDENLGE